MAKKIKTRVLRGRTEYQVKSLLTRKNSWTSDKETAQNGLWIEKAYMKKISKHNKLIKDILDNLR